MKRARQDCGKQQRAQKLDGHGGAEGDALDAGVEEAVHCAQRQAQRGDGEPLFAVKPPDFGAGEGEQDECGDAQAR
ncbi:hypothetical protein HMPREF2990_05910 [Corynebacterium sp. HMSC071B10]|nr:hypothetical protein HMPREF2990_05910 [Corynebacterium sp. HMSC071B10]